MLMQRPFVLQLNQLRCLHDFAEAQATYYAQCHHYMQQLQRELSRSDALQLGEVVVLQRSEGSEVGCGV